MKLKRKILTALFAAILCVLAPISVSVGAIPVSLGTFCVCVLALLVDRRCVPIAILLYAALGTVGLPVFAGFVGGGHILIGPTGGYLFGYIPMALTVSFVAGNDRKPLRMIVAMILGYAVCYGFGAGWYMISANVNLKAALIVGVLPFLPFDAVKIAAACALTMLLGKRIDRLICPNREER